jgi:hypothetical protein
LHRRGVGRRGGGRGLEGLCAMLKYACNHTHDLHLLSTSFCRAHTHTHTRFHMRNRAVSVPSPRCRTRPVYSRYVKPACFLAQSVRHAKLSETKFRGTLICQIPMFLISQDINPKR